MEKLNLVELLRDCPTGMELDCTLYENVEFDHIDPSPESKYPIHCLTRINGGCNDLAFTPNGCNDRHPNAKCVIFPKGKTTWEGFQRPFKDGDILYIDGTGEDDDKRYDYIFIFNEIYNSQVYSYCHYYIPNDDFKFRENERECLIDDKYPIRFATEQEKQKLFDAIKDSGYKWNAETKTLEKLVEPKFKVGDKIEKKCMYRFTIAEVKYDYYLTKCGNKIPFDNQDDFSLVPFDITTLKAFESRVLVRDYDNQIWIPTFWGKYLEDDSNCRYLTFNGCYKYCIPYERNEHLLGTTNDCDPFFKTWKK